MIKLEALRIVFGQTNVRPHVEENLRRESLLKSALFSARVEGNPLVLEKLKLASEKEKETNHEKLEVFNLLRSYRYVYSSKSPAKLSQSFIKKLHQISMKGISSRAGKWRTESWAIFNQAGVAIYLAPPPSRLPAMMKEFVQLGKKIRDEVPIKAAVLQFLFEKIHPFADGNGRVGRLISTYTMNKGGYGFRGLVSAEEIIDKNREDYYQSLEPSNDTTSFVEFFLSSFVEQAELVLSRLDEKEEEAPEDLLLPRRWEILEIIKDHPYCSFDFISRRFLSINPKTLHYDLQKKKKKKFIIKAGKTRGATYRSKS